MQGKDLYLRAAGPLDWEVRTAVAHRSLREVRESDGEK